MARHCLAIETLMCWCVTRDFDGALTRLNAMARGIGDPLVAIYTRAYICRVSVCVHIVHILLAYVFISHSIITREPRVCDGTNYN